MNADLPMRNEELIARYRRPLDMGNPILNIQPMNALLMMLMLSLVGVFMPGWVWSAGVVAAFVVVSWLAGVGKAYTVALANLFLVVGLILFILRALLIPGTTLFAIGPVKISQEGFTSGLEFSLNVMVICAAVGLFFTMVPRPRLTNALERMRVSPRVSYVILASFQAITDLGKNSRVVLDAQKARGIESEKGLVNRVGAFFPVLAPVFLVALTQTEEKAIALDARAFNSSTKKTALALERKVPLWEWLIVGLIVIASVGVLVGGKMEWLSLG